MKDDHQYSDDPIAASEIMDELSRVISREPLKSSPQLCEFLRYVVEATLQGQSERLKGYTIAIEVMKRPASFDPQSDPIVRVQAKRLRDALRTYYAKDGQHSPLVISIAKGGYTPVFERRTAIGETKDPQEVNIAPFEGRRLIWRTAAFGLAIIVVAAGAFSFWPPKDVTPAHPRSKVAGDAPSVIVPETVDFRATRYRPSVHFTTPNSRLPAEFNLGQLIELASRFEVITVVNSDEATARAAAELPRRHHYSVEISLCQSCTTPSIILKVTAMRTGEVIPSPTIAVGKHGYRQATIDIARAIGSLDGPVLSHMRRIRDRVPESFACANDLHAYFQSYDADIRARILRCIDGYRSAGVEDALMEHAIALMGLDALWRRERPAQNMDVATRAAIRAIELAPSFARMHYVYGLVLAARGELDAALKATERAYDLNPNDDLVIVGMGSRLLGLNRFREARAFLEPLHRESLAPPAWLTFNLATAYLIDNDFTALDSIAYQLRGTASPYGQVILIIAESRTSDKERARRALQNFRANHAAAAANIRDHIGTFYRNPVIAEKIAAAYFEAVARIEN